MSEQSIRLLLIEDKKHDFVLSNRTLERSPLNCEITWVQRGAEALSLLQAQNFDVVTLDFNLPDMNGLEVFQAILDQQINVPVIFVTGSGNEPVAVQAMKRGAQDYLVKDADGHYLELLPAVIEKVLHEWQNRRATEAAAAAEKALLLEKERMLILSDFITNASHEFRTPLSVMKTALYLLGRHSDNEKQQQHIQRIEHQISNLSALVEDLVTMARIDRSSHFHSSTVYINDILRQSIETFQAAITEVQHTLLLELDANLPSLIGDANELMLAFKKLLDNAIRFTPKQGHIRVRTSANPENICIEIQDSGIGMNEETREHAFERFHRADKAHSTRGFGLGLSIALAIVEKHGGSIEIESELDKGTLLRVMLPLSA
jgi:signal transduction histidine kinase